MAEQAHLLDKLDSVGVLLVLRWSFDHPLDLGRECVLDLADPVHEALGTCLLVLSVLPGVRTLAGALVVL